MFRICIPIQFQPHGGGFYFLNAFRDHLERDGNQVTNDVSSRYDILFTNHWMTSVSNISRAIRHNPDVRIVQRIDGSAQDYGRHDDADERQASVNRLADLTIFQSNYARYATREKFQVIHQDGPIIYNPVDLSIFNPKGTRRNLTGNYRVASVSWSTNALKGAMQIYATAHANPTVHFYLCGNFPGAPNLMNIHNLGVLGRNDLAEVLRSCDVLLTYSQNEACPNHVLEALASGLPILYKDSGAMSELIDECGLAVDVKSFATQLNNIFPEKNNLSENARRRAEMLFNPNLVFETYIQRICECLDAPTRVPVGRRFVSAWFQWRPTKANA
jgi:glycosyltransferase involved in cell wall biosynthesis